MKKLIFALLLFPTIAWAEPFLVCDDPPPEEQVTAYNCKQDGVLMAGMPTPAPLMYDLQNITPGAYEFTCTAINAWGEGDPNVDPYISPSQVAPPQNLRVTIGP